MIYFLKAQDVAIKIGHTKHNDVRVRINSIKPYCPQGIELLGTIEGDEDTERALHIKFIRQRVRGEWFNISILKEIEGIIRNNSITVLEGLPLMAYKLRKISNEIAQSVGSEAKDYLMDKRNDLFKEAWEMI